MSSSTRSQPAILGGPKAVTLDQTEANRWPILTEEDEQAVLQVMRSGDLSLHPVNTMLEEDYSAYFGGRRALTHCNGTAALLAAYFALDLQPGDEVLVPTATHWASVLPMCWVGAVPVFCESEPERLGLDPEDVERRVTPRTKAICIVHLLGMPSKMDELTAIARKHGLKIVEDASHAHGAAWNGRKCGTLGDLSVLSLQGKKLAPAGEGGVLLTDSDEYYERALCVGDMLRIIDLKTPARRFAGTGFGLKTRMAPLSAAVGRVQLKYLDERNRRRNENIRWLSERLEELGFDTYLSPDGVERVYFEYMIRYENSGGEGMPIDALVKALCAEGCQAEQPRYPLLHQQPFFTEGHAARVAGLTGRKGVEPPVYQPDALPVTTQGHLQMIRLPTFPRATPELLEQYAHAFEKVLSHADAIAGAVKQ